MELASLLCLSLGQLNLALDEDILIWIKFHVGINHSFKGENQSCIYSLRYQAVIISEMFKSFRFLQTKAPYLLLIALLSIGWSFHLLIITMSCLFLERYSFGEIQSVLWSYSSNNNASKFTFIGGLSSETNSLSISDVSHHHLSLGLTIAWASDA